MKLSNEFERTFQDLPKDLREPLGQTFSEIKHNFTLGKHEPSELNGGKFAEVVLRILEWHTSPTKQFTAFGARIPDFGQATRRFEGLSGLPDSVRFHIPKLIGAIYTLRNKRGVGHVGGDINPNHMDASLISAMASWIMAELVRLFHKIDLHEAQSIVDSLMDKSISVIWEVGDKRRVIKNGMRFCCTPHFLNPYRPKKYSAGASTLISASTDATYSETSMTRS